MEVRAIPPPAQQSASPGFSRNASYATGFGRPIPSASDGAPQIIHPGEKLAVLK